MKLNTYLSSGFKKTTKNRQKISIYQLKIIHILGKMREKHHETSQKLSFESALGN